MTSVQAIEAADSIARQSYGKLLAYLTSASGDMAAAEDALQEALAAALKDWPVNGLPENPEGWLMTVAKRRLVDATRRTIRHERALERLADLDEQPEAAALPDRRLALMFACAHPAIEASVRAPLILQTLLGFTAEDIASAFLTSPAAMSKRLVRAKEKISGAGIPFEVPCEEELPSRVATVLDAIYAAYSKGWTEPGQLELVQDLSLEAIYLAHLVVEALPEEPEACGLLALMLYAEARREARRSLDGDYVPFSDQHVAQWDFDLIRAAEAYLSRAGRAKSVGRYQIEAALQSAHIHRKASGAINWKEIVTLYDALFRLTGSPVAIVNRAWAVSELHGPNEGLESLRAVEHEERVAQYQPYWATRADLLAKAGRVDEARHAYDVAIGLETDPAVRRFLQGRLASLLREAQP